MSYENFRKIDIDALDPEGGITKQELVADLPPVDPSEIQARAQQVRGLISKGDYSSALQYALTDPPYGGDDQIKDLHLRTVLDIFTATKSSDITGLVESLDGEQQSVLIKYIYKGMAALSGQSSNGGILLAWFEKTIDVTGQGSIVRYMSDRKTV